MKLMLIRLDLLLFIANYPGLGIGLNQVYDVDIEVTSFTLSIDHCSVEPFFDDLPKTNSFELDAINCALG
jgi:hypothetical protein